MNLLQLSHHYISVVLLQESHRGPFPLETARSIDEVKPSFLVGRKNKARSVKNADRYPENSLLIVVDTELDAQG